MQLRFSDGNEYRYHAIQRARQSIYGQRDDGSPAGNKTDAVVKSCLYLHEHTQDLREAMQHSDMTQELAEILSHGVVPVEFELHVETAVGTEVDE